MTTIPDVPTEHPHQWLGELLARIQRRLEQSIRRANDRPTEPASGEGDG